MKQYLLLFLLVAVGSANYIVNGDFEQPLTNGWGQRTWGSYCTVNQARIYDPDPDVEAYAYKGNADGYSLLFQVATVPSTNLNFSANVKLYAYDNNASAWTGASFKILYLNAANTILGETRICQLSAGCPWSNTRYRHLITVSDSIWHNYTFNINSELANLPGVNPSEVSRIGVALFDSTEWC